jgi:hypothetical protein
MLRLNSIFKLFSPASVTASEQKKKGSRHLVIETVYGGTAANRNRLHAVPPAAVPVVVDKTLLAKQKEILHKQGRYCSIEEVTLDKNTLLIGLGSSATFVFMFSFNLYYRSKEWNSLKKLAAEKNTGIACYEPKRDDIACLKLIKTPDSEVCSYLVHSKAIDISPTRGWLVRPPSHIESNMTDNHRNRMKLR